MQSTMGTVPLAEVREAGRDGPLMFFQLYVIKDRAFTKGLIQRASNLSANPLHEGSAQPQL